MIQLYAHRQDLIQSEIPPFTGKGHREHLDEWIQSFKDDGILKQLMIKPNGFILDGNIRYEYTRNLGVEYLPIDLRSLIGLYVNSDASNIRLRKGIIDYFKARPEQNQDSFFRNSPPIIPRVDKRIYNLNYSQGKKDEFAYYNLDCISYYTPDSGI